MDWVAIGAIATIGLVIVGYFQLRKQTGAASRLPASARPEPKVITYRIDEIEGSIPPNFYEPLRQGEFNYNLDGLARRLSRLGASRIEIENKSNSVVEDVRLRLRIIGELYSLAVASTKHLATEAVKIEREGESVRITMEDLPKGEVVVLAAFHEGGFGPGSLKSERANIELLNAEIYSIRYGRGR